VSFVLELRYSLGLVVLWTVEYSPIVLKTCMHLVVNVDLAVQLRQHFLCWLLVDTSFFIVLRRLYFRAVHVVIER